MGLRFISAPCIWLFTGKIVALKMDVTGCHGGRQLRRRSGHSLPGAHFRTVIGDAKQAFCHVLDMKRSVRPNKRSLALRALASSLVVACAALQEENIGGKTVHEGLGAATAGKSDERPQAMLGWVTTASSTSAFDVFKVTCMYVIAGRRLVQQEALPLLPPPAPPPPLPQQQPQQSAEPPLGVVVGRQARAERIEQTNSESASLLHARFEGCAR